jgi:hypothetical protein
MKPDDLDRILSSEEFLEPSSGFGSNVMDAVRRQAEEPPPLPFPWGRFATGLAACSVMAGAGTILLLRGETTFPAVAAPLLAVLPKLGYATAALVVSLGLGALPRLLARR